MPDAASKLFQDALVVYEREQHTVRRRGAVVALLAWCVTHMRSQQACVILQKRLGGIAMKLNRNSDAMRFYSAARRMQGILNERVGAKRAQPAEVSLRHNVGDLVSIYLEVPPAAK